MKKSVFAFLVFFGISLMAQAQWDENADNHTTGNLSLGGSSTWAPLNIYKGAGTPKNEGVAISLDGTSMSEIGYRFKANGSNYYQVMYNGGSIQWKYYNGDYTPRLTLTNGGYLGIGITSPSSPLHIKSSTNRTLKLDYTGSAAGSYTWKSLETNSSEQWRLVGRYEDNSNLEYWNKSSEKVLTLLQSGRIGIGTTAPSAELEIKSKSGNNPELHINAASNDGRSIIRFQDAGTSTWGFLSNYPNTGKFSIYNYQITKNALVIDQDSKIGIGTNSPEQILHVEKSGNTFLQLENTGSNGSIVKFGAVNSNGKKETQIQFEDEFGLYDHANGNWRLKVKRNGKVGIGTTDPDALLTVAGNIKSQEVKVTVDAGQGPDYVFEEDYNLRSLEETEAYIKANKHLPEVPSAKVMESEGLNLKEMNLMLLQKIEELTLHQIEQNKTLKNALEKIESLENEIETLKEN
jgi:hypothetical protein